MGDGAMGGCIRLCATPIGNLEDITLRALRCLRESDLIACEDTRHTLRLLSHYEIKKPLVSLHEHNWRARAPQLVQRALEGAQIALVSDAGTPGLSDPGAELVQLAIEAGVRLEALPGASAMLAALVPSGLSMKRFCFEGFLPREKKALRARIREFMGETRTIVVYESPYRIQETLRALYAELGDRRCVVARELTKVHEEYVRGTLSEAVAWAESVRGECVILLAGAEAVEREAPDAGETLARLRDAGMDKKAAIAMAAELCGAPKKAVYALALGMRWEDGE